MVPHRLSTAITLHRPMGRMQDLIDRYTGLEPSEFGRVLTERTTTLFTGLVPLAGGTGDAEAAFISIVMGAVAGDGELTETEYNALAPYFDNAVGRRLGYDEVVTALDAAGSPEDHRSNVRDLARTLDGVSRRLGEDVAVVSILFCSVDRDINDTERAWLLDLLDD